MKPSAPSTNSATPLPDQRSRPRAVVVVAYGGTELLEAALLPLGSEHVVVVDNSSAPATRTLVETWGHTYIDPGANLGFAAGVNVGLRHLEAVGHAGDVLLLNPDARIEIEALDALQAGVLAAEDIAAASPTVVGPDGAPHLTWYSLPSPAQMWTFALRLPFRRTPPFLIGSTLLLRAEAIATVGLFDERYFLYGEEADWQRRAFDGGWRAIEVQEATALHHGGASSEDDRVRIARVIAGQELYVRIWYGARGSISYRLAGWLAMLLRVGAWSGVGFRSRCYRIGPRRAAPLPPAPRVLTILQVSSHALSAQAAAERASEPGVSVASGFRSGLRALRSDTAWDVIHVRDRASLVMACLTGPWHGARIVADESVMRARIVRWLAGRRVALVVADSGAVDYRQAN